MDKHFSKINEQSWFLDQNEVPLCYPLTVSHCDVDIIKKNLAKLNIFVPTYWQDSTPRLNKSSFEFKFMNNTLFLPIDHRLSCIEIKYVINIVDQMMKDNNVD